MEGALTVNKETKAKILTWTFAIRNYQNQINELQSKMSKLNQKRLEVLEEEAGAPVQNIDISRVDPLTFEGEIDMSVANKGDE